LVIYLFFSDLISSSVGLLVSKRNFVLKSSFPMWVVLVSNFIRASFAFAISLCIVYAVCLAAGYLSIMGVLSSLISIGISLVFLLGVSCIFALVGPFVGDLSQGVRLAMRVLFYASPITYPMLNVPENYQALLWINPLTSMIEPFRNSILYPESSQNIRLAIFLIVGVAVSLTAWWMYHRLRGVMSDVV